MKKKNIQMTILTVILLLVLAGCANSGAQLPENNVDIPVGDEVFDATEDTGKGIVVLGELLEGYEPYVDGFDGVILIPLFPVAEKLGIEAEWNEEEQSAFINGGIYIWVDADYYVKGNSDPVTFGPAPQLINDILYVPMYFFQYVVGGFEASIVDGAVVIELAGE